MTGVTAPDGTRWRYKYDPFGRRVSKQHVTADGQVTSETTFTWDGPVVTEQAESVGDRREITTWTYYPGTATPLSQSSRGSLREAPQDEIDQRFYSIITNLAGTPTELVSPDGTLAGYQRQTLWGQTRWEPDGARVPLRFPGQYEDPETGLHYNNQRYYDPASGAYLTPDPLGLSPAPNPHAYVTNPHTGVDPLGLEEQCVIGAAKAEADKWRQLQAEGKVTKDTRPSAAESIKLPNGNIYTSPSFKGTHPPLHPVVQDLLDSVPQDMRASNHEYCGLPKCLSDAITNEIGPHATLQQAKDLLQGSDMAAVKVRGPNGAAHGTNLPPCDSCQPLVQTFGLNVRRVTLP